MCAQPAAEGAGIPKQCRYCPPDFCHNPELARLLKKKLKDSLRHRGVPERLLVLVDRLPDCPGCIRMAPKDFFIGWRIDPDAYERVEGVPPPRTLYGSTRWSRTAEKIARDWMKEGVYSEIHIIHKAGKPCECCIDTSQESYTEWRERDERPEEEHPNYDEDFESTPESMISYRNLEQLGPDPADLTEIPSLYRRPDNPVVPPVDEFLDEPAMRFVQVICDKCQGLADRYNALGDEYNDLRELLAELRHKLHAARQMSISIDREIQGFEQTAPHPGREQKMKELYGERNRYLDDVRRIREELRTREARRDELQAEAGALLEELKDCEASCPEVDKPAGLKPVPEGVTGKTPEKSVPDKEDSPDKTESKRGPAEKLSLLQDRRNRVQSYLETLLIVIAKQESLLQQARTRLNEIVLDPDLENPAEHESNVAFLTGLVRDYQRLVDESRNEKTELENRLASLDRQITEQTPDRPVGPSEPDYDTDDEATEDVPTADQEAEYDLDDEATEVQPEELYDTEDEESEKTRPESVLNYIDQEQVPPEEDTPTEDREKTEDSEQDPALGGCAGLLDPVPDFPPSPGVPDYYVSTECGAEACEAILIDYRGLWTDATRDNEEYDRSIRNVYNNYERIEALCKEVHASQAAGEEVDSWHVTQLYYLFDSYQFNIQAAWNALRRLNATLSAMDAVLEELAACEEHYCGAVFREPGVGGRVASPDFVEVEPLPDFEPLDFDVEILSTECSACQAQVDNYNDLTAKLQDQLRRREQMVQELDRIKAGIAALTGRTTTETVVNRLRQLQERGKSLAGDIRRLTGEINFDYSALVAARVDLSECELQCTTVELIDSKNITGNDPFDPRDPIAPEAADIGRSATPGGITSGAAGTPPGAAPPATSTTVAGQVSITVPIVDDGTAADQTFNVDAFWERVGAFGVLLGSRFVIVPDASLPPSGTLNSVQTFNFGPIADLCDPSRQNNLRASCPANAAGACTVDITITQGAVCSPASSSTPPGTTAVVPCNCI